MRKRLREIAGQSAADRIVFLGQQSDVIAQCQQPIEQVPRIVQSAEHRVGIDEPEAASQKNTLARLQAVVGDGSVIAHHEAVLQQARFDRGHRADEARVLRGNEAEGRQLQQGRIEQPAAIGLHETAERAVKSFLADIVMDRLPDAAPVLHRPVQSEMFDCLDRTIESHPGHDLREREVLRRAAHLPHAGVRLAPDLLEMAQQGALQSPVDRAAAQAAATRLVQRIHHLAIHVELHLRMRRIADAHRHRSFVSRQPRKFPFAQPALAGHAVHDLHLRRIARDRAQQPVAPRRGFAVVAGIHECEQGQRGIAQPAITIVPIAFTAESFRQRGGWRRNNAAARRIDQRTQADQRTHDLVLAGSLLGAACDPVLPEAFGLAYRVIDVHGFGWRQMRGAVGE